MDEAEFIVKLKDINNTMNVLLASLDEQMELIMAEIKSLGEDIEKFKESISKL